MGILRDKSVMLTGSATGLGYSFTSEFGTESVKFLLGEFGERQLASAIDCILEARATASRNVSDFTADTGLASLVDGATPFLEQVVRLFANLI